MFGKALVYLETAKVTALWRRFTPLYERRTSIRRLYQFRKTHGAAAWRPVVKRSNSAQLPAR